MCHVNLAVELDLFLAPRLGELPPPVVRYCARMNCLSGCASGGITCTGLSTQLKPSSVRAAVAENPEGTFFHCDRASGCHCRRTNPEGVTASCVSEGTLLHTGDVPSLVHLP